MLNCAYFKVEGDDVDGHENLAAVFEIATWRRIDLLARTKFSELHGAVVAKPGATERLAALRVETLEEIRLYELRHGEAISQVELAGRLDVTQGAISKLEHSDDVRVSTLRQYLEALGARLELVAVFDDDARRVPVHLGKGSAA